MKLVLTFLLLIYTVNECRGDREARKYRLSHIVKKLEEEEVGQYELNKISETTDIECVKSFFKLPQNDKMIVNELESSVLAVAATLKCSDENKVLELYINAFISDGMKKHLYCLKFYLKEIEPASKFVQDFEASDEESKKCKVGLPLSYVNDLVKKIEHIVGPLNVFTCGAVTGASDYVKFIALGSLIKNDNITEDLKVTEMGKLRDYFKEITLTTANCIIKRFEDDPKAFLANNTLNHFYNTSIKPSEIDGTSESRVKDLAKVKAHIDHDCVKARLNLPKNGQKTLLNIEATLVIITAQSKCITVDTNTFVNDFLKYAISRSQSSERKVICAKYKLNKIEPASKLAILPKNGQDYDSYCNYSFEKIYPISIFHYNFEKRSGKLNESTCGVFTEQDMAVNRLKTMLLANEMDEELRTSEGNALFVEVSDKLRKLSECILKRIQ